MAAGSVAGVEQWEREGTATRSKDSVTRNTLSCQEGGWGPSQQTSCGARPAP